ncbi:ATP synthase F0F1 subunit delta [Staphylococcus microti]|uniref:ATP synthase subunit delta n=1 Tax=Staphylococcus microti TaxID=569857 RepID=A0A0D6XRW1_9STAP|nr:F0F1 ATP synthase subunit delta [Staphylococcus microti]KIX91357.1 ATP synthase F0F1 subunit delta [Staphylococcus microti]PNZ75945.1 F0F1 ATP synthase subunit delta [Staphylococcus microti]SUM58046.1 ATP synthase F1 subunit delta [Staphylococcus microti]
MANVAQKYAQALFDVALKAEVLTQVYDELTEIHTAVRNEKNLLGTMDYEPKITANERRDMVAQVFQGVHPYLMNTLKVIATQRNFRLLPEIYRAFEESYYAFHGLADAYVESAASLSDEELEQVKRALLDRTGLKDLNLHSTVNPELIGGVRVKIGTKVYDGSIQNDLNQLVKQFSRVY